MTKGLQRALKRSPPQRAQIKKITIPLNALVIAVAGVSGNGFGATAIAGLPEGNVLILGAVANIQFTAPGAAATVTWTGSYGVGSAANADATLSGTDVDVIPSATLNAATALVSPNTRAPQAGQVIIDNTDSTKGLYLNLLVDDATISANGNFTASGSVTLLYAMLQDD